METQDDSCGLRVSMFDDSAENHFRAMDTISQLCSDHHTLHDDTQIQRFSSSLTFLREWRLFNYEPRDVQFQGFHGVQLHQFSSATVPHNEGLCEEAPSQESRDFVMYVGGAVWALDWCPSVCETPDARSKCEFIAISAHPPGSSYHKLGAPLSGRGLVQIWCVLNTVENKGAVVAPVEKPKRDRKRSTVAVKEKPDIVKRPRGRPRKNPVKECEVLAIEGVSSSFLEQDGSNVNVVATKQRNNKKQPLVKGPRRRTKKQLKESIVELDGTKVVENSSTLLAIEGVRNDVDEPNCLELISYVDEGSVGDDVNQLLLTPDQHDISFLADEVLRIDGGDCGESGDVSLNGNLEVSLTDHSLSNEVALPRLMLCLAHNGKVAWDVKWRPCNVQDSSCKHRMGFLAVLLGNGSLEVWEVPLPHTIKALYSSSNAEGTDPRFVKLKPVFRCSMLKSGGVQSIPLTVEWSASDFLLVGCHDGTVALWKFCPSVPSKDTRPLLCFSADTAPIRAVAWAPVESDSESGNVIVTAGHEALKFWDIRDPFRPLWDIHLSAKIIYGLDWLSDPRCLLLSFGDGTMKILSLSKAVSDLPATGKPFSGTKQQGLYSYCGSLYAIWSVQASRPLGMAAYCGADGTVVRFQLTTRAVDKEFSRGRTPHFVCGSLTMNGSCVTINTPEVNTPLKPLQKSGEAPLALRNILSDSTPSKRSENKKKGKQSYSNDQAFVDTEIEPDLEVPLASLMRKKPSKSSSGCEEKPEDNLQLVLVDDELNTKTEKEKEKDGKYEVLPSKDISIHRVRWNMNKGSERWLCYGGAAGIVRCQEIVLSKVDQRLAKKK